MSVSEASWWPAPAGLNRVIVPVIAATVEEVEQQARAVALADADLVEWRADGLIVPLPAATLAIIAESLRELVAPKPLLFTWRTSDEGGLAPEEVDDGYAEIVAAVLRAKTADLVDVQVRHPAARRLMGVAKEAGVPVVGSWHDTQATPPLGEIVDALAEAESLGASVAKVAVTPCSQGDVITLLSATSQAAKIISIPMITMSMGELGLASRVFGHMLGSQATFATVGAASAPGQLELPALKQYWGLFTD